MPGARTAGHRLFRRTPAPARVTLREEMDVGGHDNARHLDPFPFPGGRVSCARFFRFPTIAAGLAVAACISCATLRAAARGVTIEFRPPSIVLAYPAAGGALPADKPLVVFRFDVGQRDDPIDPSAFRATLDGVDHTARFRVTPAEAWGQLADSSATPSLTPGTHVIGARVCSARGACGSVSARVEVRPWDQVIEPPKTASSGRFATPNDIPLLSPVMHTARPGGRGDRPDSTGA